MPTRISKRIIYAISVPVLTVALTAAATFLSARTFIMPDVASVSFGFPFSWLTIGHGFINAPPVWTVDSLSLAADVMAWLAVSVVSVYLWMRLRTRAPVAAESSSSPLDLPNL